MPVEEASWWRRHRVLASLAAIIGVAVLTGATVVIVRAATAPELDCDPGMVANASSSACIGLNLTGGRFSPDQPDRLSTLLADIKSSNDAVPGTNYVSIVLLLNFSPIKDVDTHSYAAVYQEVEGALTAVWQANHTAAYSGSPQTGTIEPKIKLFLANMGSKNADWQLAVDQIAANARDSRITSVVGLGQSSKNTRQAATRLTTVHNIPMIGATVVADSMNFHVQNDTERLKGFFRTAPTNSGMVHAATQYITQGLRVPLDKVAIVEDSVASDDYVTTLVREAHATMGATHRFHFTSPDINTGSQARDEWLRGQFGILDINLCNAKPEVVFFAGRGTDIGTFVKVWTDSNTECSHDPLLILTGDDGVEAVHNDDVAVAVGSGRVKVQYTGLSSPGVWGDCPADPTTEAARGAFDQFRAAFTGEPSCDAAPPAASDNAKRLSYPADDLANGQAILTHDATALAVVTARRAGPSAVSSPMSQIGVLQETRCDAAFHGASGIIQFSADPAHYGNRVGAIVPIVNVTADQKAVTIPPGWSTGGPSPEAGC